MTLLPALLLLAAPAPTLPLVPTPALVLTQDDEKPDKREEVKELLDTFSGHCKKRGAEDLEAIGVVDALLKEFPESGPKDRKAIVAGLGKAAVTAAAAASAARRSAGLSEAGTAMDDADGDAAGTMETVAGAAG